MATTLNHSKTSHTLYVHPTQLTDIVQTLQVSVEKLSNGDLQLCYELTGEVSRLLLPRPQPAIASDGLWQHCCFEVFIAQRDSPAYYEFNFSPSTQWAVYQFSDYRVRSEWTTNRVPQIQFSYSPERLRLTALIATVDLPLFTDALPWQLGISAVLETIEDQHYYFALHHPAAQPDFHHRAGFALTL